MGIYNNNYENIMDLESALNTAKRICSYVELKMMYLEIVAVVVSDDELDEKEDGFLNMISEKFDIPIKEKEKAISVLKKLRNVYFEMKEFIKEK